VFLCWFELSELWMVVLQLVALRMSLFDPLGGVGRPGFTVATDDSVVPLAHEVSTILLLISENLC